MRGEIDYCRQDVRASVGLLNALLAEFRKYPVGDLPPDRVFSAASIASLTLSLAQERGSINFGTDDVDVVVRYVVGPEPITVRLRRV